MNPLKFIWNDWKKAYAVIVVYGYGYDIVLWPVLFWGTTIGTAVTGNQWPGPPLVPWEQLAVATANLAVIGGIQFFRDQKGGSTTESTTETKTTVRSPDPEKELK